jgi:outer membrane protein OmpA-like peptidoglycan-associated protein
MELIRTRYADKFVVRPFTAENLAKAPLLFIGTFTAINSAGQQSGPRDAYRIWFSMADLKTKKLISKGQARATPEGIDPTPTAAFADSAVWLNDASIGSYVQTCQGTKVGDPINPVYVDRIKVAPLISDAISAYDARDYAKALELYKQALATPGGDQLRVHNGIYLANVKLNRRADATEALGKLVDFGLNSNRLALMLLFQKNTTDFPRSEALSGEYPLWLKTVAERATAKKSCLQLVGHTSRTGPEPFNVRLSAQRAQSIRTRLAAQSPQISKMLQTKGVGWRENIVGTGRDDPSDALDRRVEFLVVDCAA